MQKKTRGFLFYFIIIFIPILLIATVFSSITFYSRYKSSKEKLINSQINELEIMQYEIELTPGNILSGSGC